MSLISDGDVCVEVCARSVRPALNAMPEMADASASTDDLLFPIKGDLLAMCGSEMAAIDSAA